LDNYPNIVFQWSAQRARFLFFALMLVLLSIIVFTFPDYGVTFDEPARKSFGNRVLLWYSSLFQNKAAVQNILYNIYGGIFEIPVQLIASLGLLLTGSYLFEIRHLVNAVVGLTGVVGAYKTGKLISGRLAGLLSGIFLALTPRFYGHMFNNPKDIPFAVFYIFSIYYMIGSYRLLPNIPKIHLIKTGIFIGLTIGVRVGGIILFGYWLVLLITWFIVNYFFMQRSNLNVFSIFKVTLSSLSVVGLAWFVMLIGWPWAQISPFSRPFKALEILSRFPWPHSVLYKGEYVFAKELPWDYIPTWFAISLPEFYFIIMMAGCFSIPFYLRSLKNNKNFVENVVQIGLLILALIFPILAVTIKNSTLYDGIRHLLFIIPVLCVLCGISCVAFFKLPALGKAKRIVGVSVFLFILLTIYDMISLHPYQTSYFNRAIAGGVTNASRFFETDYWGSAYKEGCQWLRENRKTYIENHKIDVAGCNYFPQDILEYYLNEEEYLKNELLVIRKIFHLDNNTIGVFKENRNDKHEADFSIRKFPPVDYFLASTRWMCHRKINGEILYRVERRHVPYLFVIDPL